MEDNHIIMITRTFPSGAQEWYCPTCGRRFIVQWTPEYSRVVLVPGDECSIHNTGKGAFIARVEEEEGKWLGPWEEWSQKVNFADLWNASEDPSGQ